MNITNQKIDDLNAVVSIKILPEDYQSKVDVVLKDYRKKANIPGFRPGMVPIGLVKKLYYKPILAEEINKIVSESLMNYIRDEKIKMLGEPLPHRDDSKVIDFDKDTEFEFFFDLGLFQEFSMNISEKDKIQYYTIKVEDSVVEEYKNNVTKRFGDFVPVEKAVADELMKGNLLQLDAEGNVAEEGIKAENISMSLDMMKDDSIKKLFKGKKAGDKIDFDLRKAYPSDVELASLLRIDKDLAAGVNGEFRMEIAEILEFRKHELNQELFDKVYGENAVKSESEFLDKLVEELKVNYERESNYKFAIDSKDYLIKKAKLALPVEFLKRWILETNEKMNPELLEKEFGDYEKEFQWQLIKDQLIRENDIKVSEEELLEYAVTLARNQFYQYGLFNVPEEHIVSYAKEQLGKKDEARRLFEQKYEDNIYKLLREKVKLDKKETTAEKFKKLFEEETVSK
jgi:trigger factor